MQLLLQACDLHPVKGRVLNKDIKQLYKKSTLLYLTLALDATSPAQAQDIMALSTMNTSTVMTVVSLAILLQFRAVLSQFYSDSDLCPTPINATDETLTGAVMSQRECI